MVDNLLIIVAVYCLLDYMVYNVLLFYCNEFSNKWVVGKPDQIGLYWVKTITKTCCSTFLVDFCCCCCFVLRGLVKKKPVPISIINYIQMYCSTLESILSQPEGKSAHTHTHTMQWVVNLTMCTLSMYCF